MLLVSALLWHFQGVAYQTLAQGTEWKHNSTLNITLFFRFAVEKTQIKSGLWCMCEGGSTLTIAKVKKS